MELNPKLYYAYYQYSDFLATKKHEINWAQKFLEAAKELLPDQGQEAQCQQAIDAAKRDIGAKLKSVFTKHS